MDNRKSSGLNAFVLLAAFVLTLSLLASCKSKTTTIAEEEENLPPDIVELRDDQARLANIEFGRVEMHHISDEVALNGKVTVA
ncbi:MAG TPA: hypothetical protein VJ963_03200, partial [Bacteroidales bacterium]|nr:hypothetical protein [Bacteroidales bacterium]